MRIERVETGHGSVLSDKDLIVRAKADPQGRARLVALADRIEAGELGDRPGIGGEDLRDFLREIRGTLDA